MRLFLLMNFLFFLGFLSPACAEENPFVYDDRSRRDPLWPLVTPSGMIMNYETDLSITDLTVEGIMQGREGNNVAIINGNVVKQNNRIGQFIVSEVTKDTVILIYDNQRFELRLKKEE